LSANHRLSLPTLSGAKRAAAPPTMMYAVRSLIRAHNSLAWHGTDLTAQ
jgi:hypothetical protein